MSSSSVHPNSRRLRSLESGAVCKIEIHLPVDTAALVYEAAVECDASISDTMASLIHCGLQSENETIPKKTA